MEKNEKSQKILSFYTCVSQMTITCMLWLQNVWFLRYAAQHRIFFFLVHFLTFSPTKTIKNQNFEKMKKKTWRYHHFTLVYHKSQSYDVCFLRHRVWEAEFFVIFDNFLLFYPLITQKIKILKKWKKHLKILSFYTCLP